MGEETSRRIGEIQALQAGFDEGLWLVDTAELYADGGAEKVIGEAIRDVRDRVFLTTKVWPTHGTMTGIGESMAASLKRLQTDYVDLYLLHWPSKDYPLEESMAGLMDVLHQGMTRHIGVSNFPRSLWEQALALTDGAVGVNQVDFSLGVRTSELSLMSCAAQHHASLMAYSPVRNVLGDELDSSRRNVLTRIAQTHGVSLSAVALAWLLNPRKAEVVVIAKASHVTHVRDNAKVLSCRLNRQECAELETLYPLPSLDLALEAY